MAQLHELTDDQIAAFRLRRHSLGGDRGARTAQNLARTLCGAQAQVLSAAGLSLSVRSHKITPAMIEDTLWRRRKLVKTWSMRSTLHLHATEDLPLYLGAMAGWRRDTEKMLSLHGVTPAQLGRASATILEILADASMTRGEIAAHVAPRHGEELRTRITSGWGGLMKHLVYDGLVCFGPSRGGATTFVRTDRWLGPIVPIDEGDALLEIARRYLAAYGPATPQDFAYWSGMYVATAGSLWSRLADETVRVATPTGPATLLRRDLSAARNAGFDADEAAVLPYFDSYLLGHRAKEHLLDGVSYKAIYRSAGWIASVVLLNGRIAGTWRGEARGNRLAVNVVPHRTLRRAVKTKINEEMERIAGFNGLGASVKYG